MLNLVEIDELLQEKRDEVSAVAALCETEKRELTDEESQHCDSVIAEINDLEGKREKRAKIEETMKAAAAARLAPQVDRQIAHEQGNVVDVNHDDFDVRTLKIPARARCHGRLTAFEGSSTPEEDAFVAGQFWLATVFGNRPAHEWCQNHGLIRADLSVGTPGAGGETVPLPLEQNLIRLRELRSVMLQYPRQVPMASMTLDIPRLPDDVTAAWTAEAAEITASDPTFAQARVTAEKLACLTKVSSELDEDSILDIGNIVTQSMAWSSADKIDQAGFNGDGSAGFGNITGLANALNANAVHTAGAATITWADIEALMALLPMYPGATPRFFCTSAFYYTQIVPLLTAAGGNTIETLEAGVRAALLGYEVVFSQVMATSGSSARVLYFGDMSQGITVGQRRAFNTMFSVDRYFEYDQIGIRSTQRIGITVHEDGATDKTRPIVALDLPV